MSLGNKEIMARNIKRLMESKGVNASIVCSDLNISMSTFSDWCNAKTYPRIDKIEKLANYFQVPKSDLVESYSATKDSDMAIIREHIFSASKDIHDIPVDRNKFLFQLKENDLSLEELAELTGMPIENLTLIATGKSMASWNELIKLSPYISNIVDYHENARIGGKYRADIIMDSLNLEYKLTNHERKIIDKYRSSDPITQAMVCRALGLDTREQEVALEHERTEMEEPELDR